MIAELINKLISIMPSVKIVRKTRVSEAIIKLYNNNIRGEGLSVSFHMPWGSYSLYFVKWKNRWMENERGFWN